MATQTSLTTIVRSTEIDVNAHVNNAKYLEYLEWGREHWYEQLGLDYTTLKQMDIVTVVAHISIDYRKEAVQNDELTVLTRLKRIGNTSFTMLQTIENQRGELVVEADVVMVTVSPTTHEKVPVPGAIRQHL